MNTLYVNISRLFLCGGELEWNYVIYKYLLGKL